MLSEDFSFDFASSPTRFWIWFIRLLNTCVQASRNSPSFKRTLWGPWHLMHVLTYDTWGFRVRRAVTSAKCCCRQRILKIPIELFSKSCDSSTRCGATSNKSRNSLCQIERCLQHQRQRSLWMTWLNCQSEECMSGKLFNFVWFYAAPWFVAVTLLCAGRVINSAFVNWNGLNWPLGWTMKLHSWELMGELCLISNLQTLFQKSAILDHARCGSSALVWVMWAKM